MVAVILNTNVTFLETRNLFVVRITGSLQNSACASTWSEATPLNVPVYALERVKTRPCKIGRGYASKAGLRSDVDSIKRLLHCWCYPEHQRHFFGDA
jgi:hypothetical protein